MEEKRRLSYLIGKLRGEIAVEKVEKVLENLKKEGIIREFGQTIPFSQDDVKGVDFWIFPLSGKEIKLQVRASGNEKVAAKYRRRGIYFVAAPPSVSEKEIEEKILEILEKAKRSKRPLFLKF